MPRTKKWLHSAGRRGYRVTVYERKSGGTLWARAWDPTLSGGRGGMRRTSLGHTNRKRAEQYAREQATALQNGTDELRTGRVSLARLFRLYLEHHSPKKKPQQQKDDRRLAGMWMRVLGTDRDPHSVKPRDWQEFIQARSSGAINLHGETVSDSKRRPVGPRTVEKDLKWLKWVLNWGTRWSDSEGRYLLRENPVRGYPIPKEKNPKRPVATQDQLDALLAVADEVEMKVTWSGRAQTIRSHLRELLVVANGTGRRLSAICALTFADLHLDDSPHGSIRWPADTDKLGRETVAPMGPDVRAVIDQIRQERPGIGEAPLFPAARDRTKPIHPSFAKKLLRRAVALADLEAPSGWGWHSFRRKFAIEFKHMPDHDVAALGGWKSVDSLRLVYQQADQKTMLNTILSRRELQEARG